MDIAVEDPLTGRRWDLRPGADQNRALARLRKDRPQVLVVSPPCTQFSALQNLSGGPKPKEYQEALELLRFAVRMCHEQRRGGRTFVFEHPASATSWSVPEVLELAMHQDVQASVFHMCQYGMVARDSLGEAPVHKRTRVLTNSSTMAELLSRQCQGGHRHVVLLGGRAAAAARYPRQLCEAIVQGCYMELRGKKEKELNMVDPVGKSGR